MQSEIHQGCLQLWHLHLDKLFFAELVDFILKLPKYYECKNGRSISHCQKNEMILPKIRPRVRREKNPSPKVCLYPMATIFTSFN